MLPEQRSTGHLAPLLWHHGEEPELVVAEIEAIASSGIGELVLEPRPHPDYLGPRWWSDLRVVLEAARRLGLRVWLWDDDHFPSGSVNRTIPTRHPELRKRHLGLAAVDVLGPARGASLDLRPHLDRQSSGDLDLLAVVAAPRTGDHTIDANALVDVTDRVDDRVLYWDVPPGRWRIMVLSVGHDGAEEHTVDFVNPIAAGAAEVVLETIHQQHFEHAGADFGTVIAGFFTDEPRFGNAATYRFRLGRQAPDVGWQVHHDPLPFSDLLWARLRDRWGPAAATLLPLLWWDGDEATTARVRAGYLDEATLLYADFQRRIGAWCDEHDVEYIGHVVEDDGAHARLGYGAGHYFRAMTGQHMGGIDVVQHVRPGADGGRRLGTFGHYDDEFNHWGLAKLASSAAHVDPRKQGRAMCEAFGAYGWGEGLRLMKRITDHLVVRGVNVIVPHAFSPRVWDPDCPPHFHNGGLNPQWPHFPIWRAYAERLCSLVSDGTHVADAAVLYHAEAEWAGDAMAFQTPLAVLAREQRDADVVPLDAVVSATDSPEGALRLGEESYPVLVVPWARRQPAALAESVLRLGLRVVVVDALPVGWSDRDDPDLLARFAAAVEVVPLADLGAVVDAGLCLETPAPELRLLRYHRADGEIVVAHNESLDAAVDTVLRLPQQSGTAVIHDPLLDRTMAAEVNPGPGDTVGVRLRLEPGETRVIRFADADAALEPEHRYAEASVLPADGWSIAARVVGAETFTPSSFDDLGPVNAPLRLPRFAGTLRYGRRADLSGASAIDLGDVGETATLRVDGRSCGTRIAPPYRFELPVGPGPAELEIEVTTTLGALAADNIFDACALVEPAGLLGPVTLLRYVDV